MQKWVRSLGWEDLLEKEGNLLQCSCQENPMDRGSLAGYSPGGGPKESDMTEHARMQTHPKIHLDSQGTQNNLDKEK